MRNGVSNTFTMKQTDVARRTGSPARRRCRPPGPFRPPAASGDDVFRSETNKGRCLEDRANATEQRMSFTRQFNLIAMSTELLPSREGLMTTADEQDNEPEPITWYLKKYWNVVERAVARYWKQFARPYRFGSEDMASIRGKADLKEAVQEVLLLSSITAGIVSLTSFVGQPNDQSFLWNKWIQSAIALLNLGPPAVVLWLLLRKYQVAFFKIIIFYLRWYSIYQLLIMLGGLVSLAFLLFRPGSELYIQSSLGFALLFGGILSWSGWMTFVVPERVLSGWLRISYLRSLACWWVPLICMVVLYSSVAMAVLTFRSGPTPQWSETDDAAPIPPEYLPPTRK